MWHSGNGKDTHWQLESVSVFIDKINLHENITWKINTVTDFISSTQNFTEILSVNYLFNLKMAISII